jgi:hypothetical protein
MGSWAEQSSQNKKYKWPIHTWENVPQFNHHGHAKSKPYWDFISPQSERVSPRKQKPNVGEDAGGKGTLTWHWWDRKLVQSLWKSVWRFLRQLKRELPYDPATPFLGAYSREPVSIYYIDTYRSRYFMALFMIAKLWSCQVPINGWMNRKDVA